MRIACTGFVSEVAGSIASANALLLRGLLNLGCEITFFSKSSFVDPRPAARDHPLFTFIEVNNKFTNGLRGRFEKTSILRGPLGQLDARRYNQLLVQRIRTANRLHPFDLCLWLGSFAVGSIPNIPTVSFVQGAPGTDARSIIAHFSEIAELAGQFTAIKWKLLANLRLSRWGLPPFSPTDHFIVGSLQSSRTLQSVYKVSPDRVSTLPYPIDLNLFQNATSESSRPGLHCLWLGRIIPRKRLDLFLEGASLAIRNGVDLHLTIVGGVGFIPGYEKWIDAFPFPERLTRRFSVPRSDVPALIQNHDVLVQPSDEEDFGSSVAEAQVCGLPVIVGATSGNADYLCDRDIHLKDDHEETLAAALAELEYRKRSHTLGDPAVSWNFARHCFKPERIANQLLAILQSTLPKM